MKIAFFSAKEYDKTFFNLANKQFGFEIQYHETHLGPHIVDLIKDVQAVCVFVNDKLTREVIEALSKKGVKIIALRCAGFNNVDLEAAKEFGITVCRVPSYSPEAVAEHAVAMLLTINRKTHKAYNRVREQNFSLDGLLGYNLNGKTVGVIGTGKIGHAFIKIMLGFGCKVLAYDVFPDDSLISNGVDYVTLEELLRQSDIISLHCPLTKENHYLINNKTLALMQNGVTLINTSRGGLINTEDIISALKSKKLAALCIDVYEQEEHLFFKDLSMEIIDDDKIQRLMSFPNVLLTAHQAFFTQEALTEIAQVTLDSISKLDKNCMEEHSKIILA
ncbi:2-hydroxyacid dehydrogenase [Pedobacter changchengzhani]|uniref:2-hydroxyacid dehydrogenase n=1 Tax=Pedobacter changchengzhani TaxID=2529274 RepID=A0A4V2ZZT1_9SPHI|nr:2-hydroxyacid dehydrogenase [Pedobacter changchengzhani]TDG34963.1 2-hydroxyacid dehydrogenase [Pedobacter changchengzhani]